MGESMGRVSKGVGDVQEYTIWTGFRSETRIVGANCRLGPAVL